VFAAAAQFTFRRERHKSERKTETEMIDAKEVKDKEKERREG